jgi:signal transduction histidine kinase
MTQARGDEKLLWRYERMIEISQQLTLMRDHMGLLRRIIAAAQELTESEAASILLLDQGTGELRFEMASNIPMSELQDIVVPLEGSIAGWVVMHGEARVIEDVSRDPDFYSSVDEALQFRTRNVLAVPLRAPSKVIGALEAVNKRDGERFSSDDIKTLSILAGQAAIALENARLFQQSDFMAEMVHELRTPLAALKTSTALLRRNELPDKRRAEIIETMQEETDRLIRLTSDFLDLARLESGRAKLDIRPVECSRLLRECVDVIAPQAAERDLTVHVDAEPIEITLDRGKMKQVLLNLLTNAVKYNRDHGSIYARIRPLGDDQVQIAIQDTGYGIAKENQKQLFQKFYRAADTAGFTHGTGLGLAIVKHIIEAHGGSITLESQPNVGSTFYIELPLHNI